MSISMTLEEAIKLKKTLEKEVLKQYNGDHDFYENLHTARGQLERITELIEKQQGQQPNTTASPMSGSSHKVSFVKNGKKCTRVVQVNKRGTKCVKLDGKLVPLSKLKRV